MSRVFCVGDLNTDIFSYSRERPSFGEEKNIPLINYSLGGNAANFACALSNLGENVSLASIIGSDVFTPFLLAQLKKHSVKPILSKSKEPNGISNIFVDGLGKRAILSNKGCLAKLDSRIVSEKILPKLRKGDFVYFGGFFHFPKMRKGFPAILDGIRKKGCAILFDATFDEHGSWEMGSFIKKIDLLFINEKELLHVTKKKSLEKGVSRLFKMGANAFVVKRGEKGAVFYSQSLTVKVPAMKTKVINTTGAGDFFNAGFVKGILSGLSIPECMRVGAFAATQRISHADYFAPKKKELMLYLDSL